MKYSNIFILAISAFSLLSCNVSTIKDNEYKIIDKSIEKSNGSLSLNFSEEIFKKGFSTKYINFSNISIKKLKLEILGLGISSISETKEWTPNNPISFNISVLSGDNRVINLVALDENNNPVSQLMGLVNILPNVDNVGKLSFVETLSAQVVYQILKSNQANLINNFTSSSLKTYITNLIGFDSIKNEFTNISPSKFNTRKISEYILANNGMLPDNSITDKEMFGSLKINLNVTGAKLILTDLNSSIIDSTTSLSTNINNITTGSWYLTIIKDGYKSQNILVENISSNILKEITISLEPLVNIQPVPTPTPTISPTPVSTTSGKIAFVSERAGNLNSEIYIMNIDGTNQIRLTNDVTIDNSPSLSSDGTKIVFSSNFNIYTMNIDGTNKTKLTTRSSEYQPSWSPDGTKIVFNSGRDGGNTIYTMNTDGTNQTKLTMHTRIQDKLLDNNQEPSWSPDGTKIVFSSNRDNGNFEIYTMNTDGTNQSRVTNTTDNERYPSFSPDGTKIIFTTDSGIITMNSDGTNRNIITPSFLSGSESEPTWSIDGTKIIFNSRTGSNSEIYIMNTDHSNLVRLTNDPSADYKPSVSK